MTDVQKNVLIAEDDDLIAQMYQASLATAPFHVQIVKDGELAWNAMQTLLPNLVILDIMMPKMNGVEVLTKMRTDPKLKNIPVIMISSLGSPEDKERALAAGATAYWIKNEVNMADFAAKISQAMS